MKEHKMQTLPKCDFCKTKDAVCDAPTVHGTAWANMCEECAKIHSSKGRLGMGTKLVQHTPAAPSEDTTIYKAVEKSSMEERLLGDRIVACPECGDEKFVEPDAAYTYNCEGCGIRVTCIDPMFTM